MRQRFWHVSHHLIANKSVEILNRDGHGPIINWETMTHCNFHSPKLFFFFECLQIKYDTATGMVSRTGLVYIAVVMVAITNANNVIPQVTNWITCWPNFDNKEANLTTIT
jgi:hypothetical protein